MNEKRSLTTVAYSKGNSKKMEDICKKLGLTKTQFIDQAILYFHRTGENPGDPIKDSLPKRFSAMEKNVKKTEDRLIGFIKTQEAEFLSPLVNKSLEIYSDIKLSIKGDLERTKKESHEKFLNDMSREQLGIKPSKTKEGTWNHPGKPLTDRVDDLNVQVTELIEVLEKKQEKTYKGLVQIWNQLLAHNTMKNEILAKGRSIHTKEAIQIIDSYLKPIT